MIAQYIGVWLLHGSRRASQNASLHVLFTDVFRHSYAAQGEEMAAQAAIEGDVLFLFKTSSSDSNRQVISPWPGHVMKGLLQSL